jgi:broad specificity phosphatase PhoE
METDAGDWTDRPFVEVQAEAPELFEQFFTGNPAFAFPGGESFAAQELRVAAALREIEAGALPALVVCHGMVIRAALSARGGEWLPNGQRVLNGAIVPLDPAAEGRRAELGDEDATVAS